MARGLSRAAPNVEPIRSAGSAIVTQDRNNPMFCSDISGAEYMLTLPNMHNKPTDFKLFINMDLIDKPVMTSLQNSLKLNWWCSQLGESTR